MYVRLAWKKCWYLKRITSYEGLIDHTHCLVSNINYWVPNNVRDQKNDNCFRRICNRQSHLLIYQPMYVGMRGLDQQRTGVGCVYPTPPTCMNKLSFVRMYMIKKTNLAFTIYFTRICLKYLSYLNWFSPPICVVIRPLWVYFFQKNYQKYNFFLYIYWYTIIDNGKICESSDGVVYVFASMLCPINFLCFSTLIFLILGL